jgi:hypothetical protein
VAAAESHRASLSFPSDNGKTGPIAVSSTSRHTCPSSCPLAGDQGCYAESGFHTRLHWDRLSRGESGLPAAAFIKQVLALPAGILFRHCVAGDQWPDPSDPLRIDQALLLQLCQPTRKKSSLPTRKSPHSWGAFFPLFRPWVGSLPGAVEQLQTVCDASLK